MDTSCYILNGLRQKIYTQDTFLGNKRNVLVTIIVNYYNFAHYLKVGFFGVLQTLKLIVNTRSVKRI